MQQQSAPRRPEGVVFDTSAYPFVRIRFGRFGDMEFDGFLAEMEELIKRPAPRVLLVDTTYSSIPTQAQRRRLTQWFSLHRARLKGEVTGIAFVVPSAVMRGVLTAMFWIQPFPAPYLFVRNMAEGLDACRHWLSQIDPAAAEDEAALAGDSKGR